MVEALAKETNDRARQDLERSVAHMRDGYQLKPLSDGNYSLWLERRDGSISIRVTEAELANKGIDAIVAELAPKRLGSVGGEPPEPFEEDRVYDAN
jgi:hypothetical protein